MFLLTKDGSGIVFCGYSTKPRRYGIRAYNTRPSHLFFITIPTEEQDKAEQKEKESDEVETNSHGGVSFCLTTVLRVYDAWCTTHDA